MGEMGKAGTGEIVAHSDRTTKITFVRVNAIAVPSPDLRVKIALIRLNTSPDLRAKFTLVQVIAIALTTPVLRAKIALIRVNAIAVPSPDLRAKIALIQVMSIDHTFSRLESKNCTYPGNSDRSLFLTTCGCVALTSPVLGAKFTLIRVKIPLQT